MAVFLEDVVDADHIQVREAAGHLSFPEGTAAGDLLLGLGEVRRPDELFHGHLAFEQLVASLPDRAHPASADDGTEPVAPGKQTSRLSQLHVAPATPEM